MKIAMELNGATRPRGVDADLHIGDAARGGADGALVLMARLLGACDGALYSLSGTPLRRPAGLGVLVESVGKREDELCAFVEAHAGQIMAHLEASVMPLQAGARKNGATRRTDPAYLVRLAPAEGSAKGPAATQAIIFPLRLGVQASGFAVFLVDDVDPPARAVIEVHRRLHDLMKATVRRDMRKSAPRQNLNDRELECLQFAGDGYKSELIAEKLSLSVHTVNAYLGSATAKLDAVNRIQAIAKAIRLGYLP